MLIIDSLSHDAYFNIAMEEYLLFKFPKEDIFLLYVNAPSIIVGKFQNTLAEINLDYVQERKIKVVRRLSGGGTVYHDLGNLNFSFHTQLGNHDFLDFSTFTKPIIKLLNERGVPARLEGRNDLLVEDKKFSGNAKLVKSGKMIQHGTLLIDSEMTVLNEALKVNPLKYIDKGIKSNRSRVTNLKSYLPKGTTTQSFKNLLIEEILAENKNAIQYILTEDDLKEIQAIADRKYATWEWNFGFSPNYNFTKAIKIPAGFIEVHLEVNKGYIEKAKIFGDFFASESIEDLEELLIGKKHTKDELYLTLSAVDLISYFGNVTLSEILEVFH